MFTKRSVLYACYKVVTVRLFPFDILSRGFFDGFDLNVHRYFDDRIRLYVLSIEIV